jgi:hypothetical protein
MVRPHVQYAQEDIDKPVARKQVYHLSAAVRA